MTCIIRFLPGEELMNYLIAFLKRLEKSVYYNISKECINQLRWASGTRHHLRNLPPSVQEIQVIQVFFLSFFLLCNLILINCKNNIEKYQKGT